MSDSPAFQAEVVMRSFLRRSLTCGYENIAFQAFPFLFVETGHAPSLLLIKFDITSV
jgi:hypothetical protein